MEVFDKPEAITCDKDDSFDNCSEAVIISKHIKEEVSFDNSNSTQDENQGIFIYFIKILL